VAADSVGRETAVTSRALVPSWRSVTSRPATSLGANDQDRPDVARRRAQWKNYQGRLDFSRALLVFIGRDLGQEQTRRAAMGCRIPVEIRPEHFGYRNRRRRPNTC
jgi:hypothetical protein